jgi:dihydrolipoamide dehydrogenase
MADFDVVVLGAGPGGYVAAIRASQLGLKAAVVESKYWGGVCLNVGCIPSKALLRNAELSHILQHEKDKFGIVGDATMSFGPTHARSRTVSAGIVKGVHFLMKKNKITEIDGWGTLLGARDGKQSVEVKGADGSTPTYTCDDLIIATGAKVRLLPGLELSQNVVTYEEQILDENLPSSIIIGGSGAIGVEFAYVYASFGAKVTIVEMAPSLLPGMDVDLGRELGVLEQRLGRDAADVEAHAAPVLLLDDGGGLAELRRADGGDVAAGACTENEDIEVGRHGVHPSAGRPTL